MLSPIGPETHILNLVRGEKYYAFSIRNHCRFKGTFTDYWTNSVGYKMVHFNSGISHIAGHVIETGPFTEFSVGIYWRVFENPSDYQSYKYYRLSRFTEAEKKEIATRVVLRQRREYERGLTGTTNKDVWLPRDLVREISLKYLTEAKIGCAKRWR
jgi:hypothetical protein